MNGQRTINDEYGVDCKDCRYSRRHGAAEFKAQSDARRHAHTKAGHRVRVYQIVTITEWTYGDQAPLSDDVPF